MFYISLAKRAFVESLYKDLKKRSSHEISCRDLVQASLPRDHLEMSCPKVLPRDLLKRFVQRELLYIYIYTRRALAHRSCQKTSYGDLVQRPGEESRGLPRRSFTDSLNRDLTLRSDPLPRSLWRSPIDTLYR